MSEMQIRTYGRTAEIHVTRADVVKVMQNLTTIHRARTGDREYLATYADARDLAVRFAAGDIEIRLTKQADRISTAGRFRRARLTLTA